MTSSIDKLHHGERKQAQGAGESGREAGGEAECEGAVLGALGPELHMRGRWR